MRGVRCSAHVDRAAVFRCASCSRALCDECGTHSLGPEHFCGSCVDVIRRTSPLVRPIFSAGLFLACAVPLMALVPNGTRLRSAALALYAAIAATTVYLSYRRARMLELDFDPLPRELVQQRPAAAGPGTYRALPRQVEARVRALVPPVSGSWATLLALAALALPALVVPSLLSLPRWLEVELVLGLWWVVSALGLGHVLFHGTVAADDGDRLEPTGLVSAPKITFGPVGVTAARGPAVGQGRAILFLGVLAIGLLFLFAWLLAELLFPALFLGAYAVLATATRAATRDRHDCRGHFARSLLWGAIWATIYTAPLAVVVGLVQLVITRA
jgi:hypothetical protein